jgi:ABC-type Mn2+/Zn2+ transport system ATPase subunit
VVDVAVLTDVAAAYEGERDATLRGVSLTVRPREQLAITGPNGAGKTTILEVMNGLLPFQEGSVRVLGEPVTSSSHRLRRRIAYLPQNLFFSPDTPFLVRDVVFTARFARPGLWHPGLSVDRVVVREAMEAVGILELQCRPIGRLSGGQQRKVLLARALAQQAALLLLDEPTANLDAAFKAEIAALVGSVREELGAAAVVVSHEAGRLLDAADRILEVEEGRVVATRERQPVGRTGT